MPRPKPLTVSRPGDSQAYQILTPRSGRGRFSDDDARDARDDVHGDAAQQQAEPLLASSTSDHFPQHSFPSASYGRTTGQKIKTGLSRVPMLIGVVVVLVILGMLGLSVKRPDVLEEALIGSPLSMGTSHLHHVNASEFLSYENYTEFPLSAEEYAMECGKIMGGLMKPLPYWEMALEMGPMDVWHAENPKVCNQTITYLLTEYAGLFADLAFLAQTAAIARERNRTLFVDDTMWNRGKWTDHFQDVRTIFPGPEPGCKPPPPDELVACPRFARHWVVTSTTARYHFGHMFSQNYEDPYAHDLNRLKPLFVRAVDMFRHVIQPSAQSMALMRTARASLRAATSETRYIGVHVRRGDFAPQSWQYHGKNIPLKAYLEAVQASWPRLTNSDPLTTIPVWIASDSPGLVEEWRSVPMSGAPMAIHSLSTSGDEYLMAMSSPAEYDRDGFSKLDEDTRISATRGVIVDFAMLSGMWAEQGDVMPEAVVCAMSSMICGMAAVGFGWVEAFGLQDGDKYDGSWDDAKKRWVDVENGGVVSPVWLPFKY